MPKQRMVQVRGKKFVGVAELVDQASRMLGLVAPVQERGTVTEVPDERTVRYYLNEGLISPAEEKQGTSSVFGYRHLLQLLAVKKLQSEHLPIRKIRELVPDRSEPELERLLGLEAGGPAPNDQQATRYLDSLLVGGSLPPPPHREPRPARPMEIPAQPMASIRQMQPQMNAEKKTEELPASQAVRTGESGSVSQIPFSANAGTWERIEIQPGLEVHIRSDYDAPPDGRELRALARLILEGIEAHKKKSD